jgi:soluble lytic murein transglycosylase-like protein
MQRAQLVVLAHRLARQYAIDEHLVQAIITVESNFNPYAVSRAGAQGLMQLMPATAMRYNVDDPFDPRANVEGGVQYIKDLLQRYAGDVRWALAAYNAGEGAVARYGGIPPFPETRQYVKRVMALYSPMYQPYRLQKIYRYPTKRGGILFTDTPRSW